MQRAHNDIVSSLHFWRITMKKPEKFPRLLIRKHEIVQ